MADNYTSELEKFYSIVESIETAMMTTRRADGHLRSRAMATQKRAGGADLWFVTREGSSKLVEIENDPHVNLSYYRDGNREWVSVSGTAIISRDRNKVRELWQPDWQIWFEDEGDPLDGTADDPRMVLIGVTVHAAEFLEVNKSKPVLLFEFVKGWITGEEPEFGEMHHVTQPKRG
jgi:general stress protein 26